MLRVRTVTVGVTVPSWESLEVTLESAVKVATGIKAGLESSGYEVVG